MNLLLLLTALAAAGNWDSGARDGTGFAQAIKEAGDGEIPAASASCPPGMASIGGRFCIDRWEDSVVDQGSDRPLSPYYSPNPSPRWPGGPWQYATWSRKPSPVGYPMPELPDFQKDGSFEPKAVSRPGVYPQGFLNHAVAERACKNAGKRLCSRDEWYRACVGPGGPEPKDGHYPIAFPYGPAYEPGRCNFHVVAGHPLMIAGRSSSELDDPRLMLAESGGRRLLAQTGSFAGCTNAYGVYDMVGNQDEVVADTVGDHMVFVGGFYSRDQGARPTGCAAAISAHHASLYHDYSIGFRCCR